MSTDLLTRQSLRERQGGVWAYVSASRLALWLKCPLALRLRYIDGVSTPTNPNMFLGKVVHSGLEYWYRHRQLGIALGAAVPDHVRRARWGILLHPNGATRAVELGEFTPHGNNTRIAFPSGLGLAGSRGGGKWKETCFPMRTFEGKMKLRAVSRVDLAGSSFTTDRCVHPRDRTRR